MLKMDVLSMSRWALDNFLSCVDVFLSTNGKLTILDVCFA